ncbi:MAG: PolC-type DNA polymerase III [Clostridia bacterium]|nr:PolC-type DNA polymerase III [Clostridia bacterium]
MAQNDFFKTLIDAVKVDERFELEFVRIQHDVAGGFFLIHFTSKVLPPALYLQIEKFVRKTVGAKTKIFIAYSDVEQHSDEQIFTHIKELCCEKRQSLTPFLVRAQMSREKHVISIAFADDFGRDIFSSSGLDMYIEDYFSRCFNQKVKLKTDRHFDGKSETHKLADAQKEMLKQSAKVMEEKEEKQDKPESEAQSKKKGGLLHGKAIEREPMPISKIEELTGPCAIVGNVLGIKSFDIKNEARGKKSILIFNVTDFTSTITCKAFVSRIKCETLKKSLKNAGAVKVEGRSRYDDYSREICVMVNNIEATHAARREDNAKVKRVELHMHTNMSALDGVADEKAVVLRAAEFGHDAIAITDHGVVQAFPKAFDTANKCKIKVIYGMEAYMIDDTNDTFTEQFEHEYIVFDLETTGLKPQQNGITEIGAVRWRDGEIIDTFNTFVNPGQPISAEITRVTGITNEMVADAPNMGEALSAFKKYIGDGVLAAHNAPFDMSFINKHGDDNDIDFDNECLDTVPLFRRAMPGHRSYSLGKLAADLGIKLRHHRAQDDAECTAKILSMAIDAIRQGNRKAKDSTSFHVILLCKDKTGLFNLYKLVSESHINHFYRRPRIPKTLLEEHREGLIVGTACEAGELITAILGNKSDQEIERIAQFYDYLEIQPDCNNAFMVRDGKLRNMEAVRDITRKIVALGERIDKSVVATCDAHFIEPNDEYFRRILMHGQGYRDADEQAALFFRTTDEMLEQFAYLGEEKAYEVVVENTRAIAEQIGRIQLLPDEPAMPEIDGAAEKLEKMAFDNAKAMYGDELPDIVNDRLTYELDSIIKHGYGVLYYIAYELVKHSLENGYLVGSRGSVGSSFAATMSGITEVNPLPPHYVCPKCKHSDFDVDAHSYTCGPDLPSKDCPECGTEYSREGFGIPFAVFLGINADKVPDIDLNFSGEYQPQAHKFTVDYFGEDYVFRAGTISSIAERTAFGFVKGYMNDKQIVSTKAEVERLVEGVSGTKRTTGQHPGGLVILPKNRDINEFTPVQRPANDMSSESITTHYNFDSLHDRLVKLDILGHDDPTALHMLQELTGIDPKTIPINDPQTISLFSSLNSLDLTSDQILGCRVGSLGIPEFGTKFVRQMLLDTMPTTIGELIRISGLSHGTDVWINNAHDLIKKGTATLREAICTRDDIMNYLVGKGMDETESFYIMESVRKGKGLKKEWQAGMKKAGVPKWFINSCKKIKYMFPKAHAVAYVTMALRIAYFKVHHPLEFYATYFTVRADNLDAMYLHSADTIRKKINEIERAGKEATTLDLSQLTILEIALEMCERGYSFLPCDLYKSHATKCVIEDNQLRLPFTALGGTGETAAKRIVEAREQGEFLSVEDLKQRARISSAVIEKLNEDGCLKDMRASNQISLFDL